MAVLAAIVAAIACVGCYQPALRDCTITCAGAGDCAMGQVCGADGFCARPEVAGTCAADAAIAGEPDARMIDPPDARIVAMPDARPLPPDAHPTVTLAITIDGRGKVQVAPIDQTCDAHDWIGTACAYSVPQGDALVLTAKTRSKDDRFAGWSGACAGSIASCVVTPTSGTTTVVAAFQPKDD
ncbi:MAG TPA: hypothetical protein VL463_00700 [Kofleriaceae bacterium]|nr:hypothetical protein [Kofleriaceae bacterium]